MSEEEYSVLLLLQLKFCRFSICATDEILSVCTALQNSEKEISPGTVTAELGGSLAAMLDDKVLLTELLGTTVIPKTYRGAHVVSFTSKFVVMYMCHIDWLPHCQCCIICHLSVLSS